MKTFKLKAARVVLCIYIFSLIILSFQNCSKVQFTKVEDDFASTATVFAPPELPYSPSHGDIVGVMKPFAIEEQSVVPKTKIVLVVDNSGTMSKSQENLTKGIDSILSSLQTQIENGLNPDIEFYIVTTTIPNVSLRSLSSDNAGVFNFYGTGSDHDLYVPDQGYYFNYYRNNAQLIELNLFEPTGNKKFNHVNFEAGLKQYVHQLKNSWGYSIDLAASDKYLEYLRSKDPNSTSVDSYNVFAPQVFNDGSPLKYNARFEFNTNYPQKLKFISGNRFSSDASSIPFEKLVLNANQYLSNPNSADRIFDQAKFNGFKNLLKTKIMSVGVAGSSKEMGLCALHRSLTLSGDNKIFAKGDRAAFLIISDENDGQKTWEECPLKASVSKEQPIISTMSTSCVTGSANCVTPPAAAKTIDYVLNYNYEFSKTTLADNSDKQISIHSYYGYTANLASSGLAVEMFFPSYVMYDYYTETPIYSTEGSKIIGTKKNGLYWDSTSTALNKDLITAEELASLPGYKKGSLETGCRSVDQIAVQGVTYQGYSPHRVDLICKSVMFRSSMQAYYLDKYFNTGTVSNEVCKTISGTKCTNDQVAVVAASCPVGSINCKVDSCIQYCSASYDVTTRYSANVGVGITTADPDFAKFFASGYNKQFGVKGVINGYYIDTIFYPDTSGTTTFDKFISKFPNLPSDKIPNVIAALQVVPAPVQSARGTRTIANVTTDYREESVKYSYIGDQTAVEIPDYKTTVSLINKDEHQLVTSFHLRAQNIFGRNYFVSTIVIPNDGSYSSGQCSGVSDEQSVGSTYFKLLEDKFYTRKVIVAGSESIQVDSSRRSFADICKEDFSAALEPLKSFISRVPKNRYKLILPADREIHSVDVIQKGNKKPLSIKDWSYNGSEIVFDVDAVGIGDDVVVNLTVPRLASQ